MQQALHASGRLPQHIAIIMDGNGRWAQSQSLPRLAGHKQGVETVRDIVKASSQTGIKYLTLYAFSLENWKRPQTEVRGLMKLLEHYLNKEVDELHKNNVRITAIGKLNALPKNVLTLLQAAIERTATNDGLTLCLALSYGARWDIVRATQLLALDVRRGKLSPEDITEESFSSYLTTGSIPDPDLVIRTSGELRISNFLLWEIAYAELYVTQKNFPEFARTDLYEALLSYTQRERRFGLISSQLDTKNNAPQSSYLKRVVDALTNR
ncbi:MAG: isoprenyl transferase [Candidatus Kapabacteria bacterium]|nr:isoprenyl transferase [Candidatus Kapabacteria bacterium]